jgi:membrane protein
MKNLIKIFHDIIHNPAYALEDAKSKQNRVFYAVVKFAVFMRLLIYKYAGDHSTSRASGIAFVMLVTLIPVIATPAIIFAGIANVGPVQVERMLTALLPFAPPAVMEYIVTFFLNAQKLKGVGIIFLVIMTASLFSTIERTLNSVWKVTRARSIFRRMRSFTLMIVYSPILFFVAYHLRHSGVFGILPEDIFLMRLPPIIFTVLAFAILFWFIPNTKIRVTSAMLGGIVSCALFEIERWLFGYYVNFSFQTHTIYGPFGLLVFFLLSIYFSAMLFMLGAQAAYVHQNFRMLLRAAQRRDRRVGDYRTYITMRVIIDCVRAFIKKTPPPTLEYFCETYELAAPQATGILNWLIHEKFIHETSKGNIYVPARDFSQDSVSAVLSAIEDQHRRIPVSPHDYTKEYLSQLMDEYSRRRGENDLTMGELIEMLEREGAEKAVRSGRSVVC